MAVPVGTAYVDVRPDLSGFGRELSTNMKRVGDDAGRSLSASLSSAAKFAVAGVGISKLTSFLGGTVEAASGLNESLSKSNTVFGESAALIERWAGTAAGGFGLSRREALDAAGAFGNMFSQLGFGADQTATMSQRIVQLASDFASFHNADITDVITAQQAAFRGEYDSLQRFLPLMNAATIEQAALAETGKKTTKELTAQEKAVAAYGLMFSGAGDAAGDFARTSDSLANQQRTMNAQWEDAKVALGEGLMPIMLEAATVLNEHVIPAFKTLFLDSDADATGWAASLRNIIGDTVGFVLGAIAEMSRGIANIIGAIPGGWGEGVADELRLGADAVDEARVKLHASTGELLEWSGAADKGADKTVELGTAAAGAASKVQVSVDTLTKSLTSALNPLRTFGKDAADALSLTDVKGLLDDDKEWEASYRKLGAAAKAGLKTADDAANDSILTLGELTGNLRNNNAEVRDWLADLEALGKRSGGKFKPLAAEFAALGPEAADALDQAVGASGGTLTTLQGLFLERTRLTSEATLQGLVDTLTGGASTVATATRNALHDAFVGGSPVLNPQEAAGFLGIPYNPGGTPQLPPGVAAPPVPTVSMPAAGSNLIGIPNVQMGTPGAPAVGTINVYAKTDASPHEIALEVADTAAWRLGRPPGGRNAP